MSEYATELTFDEALAGAMGQQVEIVNVDAPDQRAPTEGQTEEVVAQAETAEPENAAPEATEAVEATVSTPPEPAALETAVEPAPLHPDIQKMFQEHRDLKAKVDQIEFEDEVPANQTPQNTVQEEPKLTIEQHFAVDPIGAIKKLAESTEQKLADIAQDSWYESQGERAPSEYRAVKEARAARLESVRTQSVVKKDQETRDATQRQQVESASVNQFVDNLASYGKQADPEKYQLVRAFSEKFPEKTAGWLWSAASTVTRQSGQVATPEGATAALEKELQDIKAVFLGGQASATPATPAPDPAKEPDIPTTLRSESERVQPAREEQDPYSDEALRKIARTAMEDMGRPMGDY
jgi:hypothetical protein